MQRIVIIGVMVVAGGCVEHQPEPESIGESSQAVSVDLDNDGIDDNLEDTLLQRHAPVAYLNRADDWTLPASIPWTLARTRMRMHHNNCGDEQIAYGPSVNTLLSQARKRSIRKWNGCKSEYPWQYSNKSWHDNDHFFLQYWSDSFHEGSQNSQDWIVYGHVHRAPGGVYLVQYWFYFAYNDWHAFLNHEGDFEHIAVELDANLNVNGVWYSHHETSTFYTPGQFTMWNNDHPVVYLADGSHATHPNPGRYPDRWCSTTGGLKDYCAYSWEYANRWFTGAGMRGPNLGYQGGGVVNVGELDSPRAGQEWIQYSGRWGEVGAISSGPRGPAYNKPAWWRRGCVSNVDAPCDGPDGDACIEGKIRCDGTCSDTTSTTVEICDTVDNDCDGQVNEGISWCSLSCSGNCGSRYAAGACACDDGCVGRWDCCDDYAYYCADESGGIEGGMF